jgi:hypothetical protein
MWNWLNCYLSGRHDFGITCSSGSIFLRCIHCGKRSNGWAVHNEQQPALVPVTVPAARPLAGKARRALPFVARDVAPRRRSA